MLCDDILSKTDYDLKTKNMNKDIILANYQQEPMDIKGRLYTNLVDMHNIIKVIQHEPCKVISRPACHYDNYFEAVFPWPIIFC